MKKANSNPLYLALAVLLVPMFAIMAYAFSTIWVEPAHIRNMRSEAKIRSLVQEVHVPIREGTIPPNIPFWHVMNYNGTLVARTAIVTDVGTIIEFNILGGPINPEPLPEPWRWFELNAAFSLEE